MKVVQIKVDCYQKIRNEIRVWLSNEPDAYAIDGIVGRKSRLRSVSGHHSGKAE